MKIMTRSDVLARLNEIGEQFVATGPGGDMETFRARGIALGVAVGVVAAIDAEYIEAAISAVSADATSFGRRKPATKLRPWP